MPYWTFSYYENKIDYLICVCVCVCIFSEGWRTIFVAVLPVIVETVSRKILGHLTEQCLICCDVGVPCGARQACDDPSSLIFPFQVSICNSIVQLWFLFTWLIRFFSSGFYYWSYVFPKYLLHQLENQILAIKLAGTTLLGFIFSIFSIKWIKHLVSVTLP